MLAILHALRAALRPSSRPLRLTASPGGPTIGEVTDVELTEAGLSITARLSPEGSELLAGPLGQISFSPAALDWAGRSATFSVSEGKPLEPWQRVVLEQGIELHSDSRRASIEGELHSADPRPDLERLRDLAEYSQHARPGRDESDFAWRFFMDSGGGSLTPWQAYQAGLRAAVARLES